MQRAKAILDARDSGLTWDQIARQTGQNSPQAVQAMVHQVFPPERTCPTTDRSGRRCEQAKGHEGDCS